MAFIREIPPQEATGDVRALYDLDLKSLGYVANYSKVFAHRPEVYVAWRGLVGAIRSSMDERRYELVTLAAASTLQSSYCMLAHGSVMLRKSIVTSEELEAIARDYRHAGLSPAEVAMMAFAQKVTSRAHAVTAEDVDALRQHGFSDAEIFDIVLTAAARSFFSKTLDALGMSPDETFRGLDERLQRVLTVGRPFDDAAETRD
jgi:uncharacterized peroxidase-related enzyme